MLEDIVNQPKEKVHCNKCKYFIIFTNGGYSKDREECCYSSNIREEHDYKKIIITYKEKPSTLNRENNCVNYKRKRWFD